MEAIKTYLLSVTCAAIICGIFSSFLSKKGAIGAVGKLLSGLFLTITVISPFAKIQLGEFAAIGDQFSADAAAAVSEGTSDADNAFRESIKAETEAYILDKAASLAASLTVEVTLSEDDPPIPCAAEIAGTVSPYAKIRLQEILSDDLGIPKEAQTWTG